MSQRRLPYVWDYDTDEFKFSQLLAGELRLGRLDQRPFTASIS